MPDRGGEDGAHVAAVSVLLPVFNGASTISASVASVLAQTFVDFELLVIDDGSTDGTVDELARFHDPRLRVVTRRENRGLVATLTEGLELARAPLVARLDADDACLPDRLARQYAVFAARPELGLLAGARQKVDRGGNAIGIGVPPTMHAAIALRLLFGNCLSHPTVMFRADAVRAVGGYHAETFPAEDYDLWVRLARFTVVGAIPDLLIRYRASGDGISQRESAMQRERTLDVSVGALGVLLEAPVDREVVASIIDHGEPEATRGEARGAVDLVMRATKAVRAECERRGISLEGLDETAARLLLRDAVLGRGARRRAGIARIARRDPRLFSAVVRRRFV